MIGLIDQENKDNLQKLFQLKELSIQGGGLEKLEKIHAKGKLSARERIEKLLDNNSFHELGAFVKTPEYEFDMQKKAYLGDGVITGYGTIDGRMVFVFSHDSTIFGGSLGLAFGKKIITIMNLALSTGAPIIGINDSGGARIQEGVSSLYAYAEIFQKNIHASGVIPQISIILGPSAGGAVYSPALTDFTIMVEHSSQMFITGPSVLEALTGEKISMEDLGGAHIHTSTTGTAQFIAKTEEESFEILKKLLGYLPSNNPHEPPIGPQDDPPSRKNEILENFLPRDSNKPYSMVELLEYIVDKNSLFQVSENYARNMLTVFARMSGIVVGIIANNPEFLAGSIDCDAALKASRFIRFCDSFSIPLITFVDTPGYLPGVHQEHHGIIKNGSKMLYAYAEATVPMITVVIRKGYGGAFVAMNSLPTSDIVLAWPSAEIAVMGPDGAANIIFKNEISSSSDPDNRKAELIDVYREKFSNPFYAAYRGLISEIIIPSDTRQRIISALAMLKSKVQSPIPRKHGNIPL